MTVTGETGAASGSPGRGPSGEARGGPFDGAQGRRRAPARTPVAGLVHGGGTVERYYGHHFRAAIFPLAAGLLLYGWRVLVVASIVIGVAAGATAVWQKIGRRGRDLSVAHGAWLGLLLTLMLPVHLGSLRGIQSHHAAFWLLPAAGTLLAIVLWLLRGTAGTALHPAIVVYLLIVPFFQHMLTPRFVLRHDRLFVGDALDAPADAAQPGSSPGWLARGRPSDGHDATRTAEAASESLLQYTLGRRGVPARGVVLLPSLLRDRLPPLEDLVMAGSPAPIGMGSMVFVIVGGLYMMYRGVIDHRVPMLILLTAFAAWLVLPVPVAITDIGARWAWLPIRDPSVGWAVAVTFANYQLAASPVVFMAFFLATSPSVRPLTRGGRNVFAVAVGVMAAVAQLYLSVAWGPYLALLLGGLLTPVLDRFFTPRPLTV